MFHDAKGLAQTRQSVSIHIVKILPETTFDGFLPMDMREYLKNRSQFPASELEKYAGQYVGWSPDGTRIVAANLDPLKVVAALKSAGYDPSDCVLSSIPSSEEVVLGGGLDG